MLVLEDEVMTEEQWPASDIWREVLSTIPLPLNSRKTQLLVVAVCQHIPLHTSDLKTPALLCVLEDFVDGRATRDAREQALNLIWDIGYSSMHTDPIANLASTVNDEQLCPDPYSVIGDFLDSSVDNYNVPIATLFRDIFGNPFRPVTFSPGWRADTAMPILADALQDAGCDNTDVLTHCRDAKQIHVRGCWVVDLVLGL